MALQVHTRPRRFRELLRSVGPAVRYAGSLTVEAAAAFPLFLFALYLLILPMRMMRTSMQMQQICEQTCEILAEAAYMQQRWSQYYEKGDPYYNPNFSLARWDYTLR